MVCKAVINSFEMTTAKIGEIGDLLARACFPKPVVDQAVQVEYWENGKPKVYQRRWFILAAFCIGYFTWLFHSYRFGALYAEYALYYDQPNELQAPPYLGIDFLQILDSALVVVYYPIAGILVDNYGLRMMVIGAGVQALGCWWWYLSFHSFYSVVVSKFFSNLGSVCIASCLLRLANNWFAEDQRSLAVALGATLSTFGIAGILVIGPLFSTGPSEVNLDVRSCEEDKLVGFNVSLAIENHECPDVAADAFCCAAPTNIDGLNLFCAFWTTIHAIFTALVVKDTPPTPPSRAGIVRKGPTFKKALQIMFSRNNYVYLCIADFLCSGPPLVVMSTIDRIFPASVSDYSNISASLAFLFSVPAAALFSMYLSRTKEFFRCTATGYTVGFICWSLVTSFLFVGTKAADVFVLMLGVVAVICYVLWTVSVYELKLEYVFTPDYAIQGYVVSVDRTIINLAGLLYLAIIPPERYKGDAMEGREFTFIVGMISMFFGVCCVYAIRDKFAYLRKAYEEETNETVAEILNEDKVYSKAPEEKVKSMLEAKAESKLLAGSKRESSIRSVVQSVATNGKSKPPTVVPDKEEEEEHHSL